MTTATENERPDGAALPAVVNRTNPVRLYSRITDPLDAVNKLGRALADSCMFGCNNVAQGQVMAMAMLAEGRSPFEVARRFHIIGGKLAMRADAMLAEFRQRGGKHKVIARTADRAEVELRVDGEKQRFAFTWDEAQQEPFVRTKTGIKDNYATPRARMQMLWARVISDAIRTMMPEVVAGQYTPTEMGGDIADEDVDAEVIDADFSVVDQPATPAEVAAAKSFVAQAATTAAPVTAEQPPFIPSGESASTAAPVESTAPGVTIDQLRDLKTLKTRLSIPEEPWKRVLAKYGVATAKDLTRPQAETLLANLRKKLESLGGTAALEAWANQQLPGAIPEGAASGN